MVTDAYFLTIYKTNKLMFTKCLEVYQKVFGRYCLKFVHNCNNDS